jgi:hypothetical protein
VYIIKLMVLVPAILTLIQRYPPSPYLAGGYTLLTCLGQPEVFYDFDYFKEGGGYANIRGISPCLERSGLSWLVCVGAQGVKLAISSNLIEVYLLGHILVSMKRQTNGIAPMLTRSSLERRQRYKIYKPKQMSFSDNFPTPAGSKCQFLNFPPLVLYDF